MHLEQDLVLGFHGIEPGEIVDTIEAKVMRGLVRRHTPRGTRDGGLVGGGVARVGARLLYQGAVAKLEPSTQDAVRWRDGSL